MSSEMTPTGTSIFDDLGLEVEEAENLKIRAMLMDRLVRFVEERDLNQTEAAERLGVGQGRISYLMNGRISQFTIDALIQMCSRAGIKVRVKLESA